MGLFESCDYREDNKKRNKWIKTILTIITIYYSDTMIITTTLLLRRFLYLLTLHFNSIVRYSMARYNTKVRPVLKLFMSSFIHLAMFLARLFKSPVVAWPWCKHFSYLFFKKSKNSETVEQMLVKRSYITNKKK